MAIGPESRDGAATTPRPAPGERDTLPSEPDGRTEVDPAASLELTTDGGDLIGGRFEILGLLGKGGMGSVYKVKDLELGEVVALKMLRRDRLGQGGDVEALREEVRLARRVTHPNVARTFDIGEHQGERFLTMEYVQGESLAEVLRRQGALPIARVVSLGRALCTGLSAAHIAGVVHRDLKPENVLLEAAAEGRPERVVITDFGIAHRSDPRAAGDAAWIQRGLIGTPAYMSPEQVDGGTVTGRSDLYALGVMLFELSTGALPFQGPSPMALAAARLAQEPPDPRKLRPELPGALAAVILRCLARCPEERYADGDALAAALVEAAPPAAPSALAATPPGASGRAPARPASATPVTVPGRPLTPSGSGRLHGGFLERLMAVQHTESALGVLPFRNSGSADEVHWAEGFTLDLVETLSLVPGLRVRAARPGPGGELDPARIGQELGVEAIVEGSLRRQGDRVRITLRLVGVADGFQLHARRFDRGSGDLLAIAEEAAHGVAGALMRPFALPLRSTVSDPTALDFYLRGRRHYHRFTREAMKEAVDLFRQALQHAPDDGRILSVQAAVLARAWSMQSDVPHPHEAALAAAQRARALSPELGEPHFAVAVIRLQEGRVLEAVEEVRQAITRSPGMGGVREVLGRLLCEVDALEPGIEQLEVALALEPDLAGARLELAKIAALCGDPARALAVLAGMPEDSFAVRLMRMRIEAWNGQTGWARLEQESANALASQLLTCLRDEQQGGLLPIVPDAQEPVWRRTTYLAQLRTEMALSLGHTGRALDLIGQLAAMNHFDVSWLRHCPLIAPLRNDPRYIEALCLFQARADEVLAALHA